ncbi:unnamed protein product [Mytilus edulis]|uniref:Uncharacterized protein n=1 Tax=Mytilus edulis TaxID=6550 RepID=A0A8S3TLA9_MYTED|nr:unnamed protein product [Mytilus edulis]
MNNKKKTLLIRCYFRNEYWFNSDQDDWICGCVIAVISLAFIRHRKRQRFHEGNEIPSSKTFSENSARFNRGYTSDLGFNVGGIMNDFGKVMDSRNNKLENEEKINGIQENMEIDLGNPTNKRNNEAAAYAYVLVSSDYHADKGANIDSKEMLKPLTIDEMKIPSTASSKYAKENMDNILKYHSENPCDNSLDHYASSVPEVYDELHDNRHKRDKVETFDTMIELTNLAAKRNESFERNKSIENQDKTILDSHQIHLEICRRGGYESVVLDGDKSVISLENNAYGHDDPRTIIQHNEEYMHNQKQEGRKINKSPIPNQTVEYAQINEATKLKYKTKSNDTDQTTVGVSASSQEGIHVKFEDRPSELTDHTETPEDETESLDQSRLRERNNTQSLVNDGKEKGKVAIVSPFVGSSVKSEGDTQKENTNAEIQQEIEDISGQTVDNAQNFGTNNQKNQQTNGDPEPSLKYNQTEPNTNQTFDNEEYPKINSVSMNDIQDEGKVDQNSEQQSSNDYEKVQIEQNQ